MLLGLLDQADGLDGQDRKHAGHQIQDQAAEDREQHEHGQSRSVGRSAAAGRTRPARSARRGVAERRRGARRSEARGDLDGHRLMRLGCRSARSRAARRESVRICGG